MLFKNDIFDLASEVYTTAKNHPTRVAVMEPYRKNGAWLFRRYTYASLSRDAESIAAGLRAHGIEEGTRTVFMAPPSYQSCALGIALTRVGATFLWIDPSVGYLNVAERLSRIAPEAFVGIPIAHAGRMAFGWGPRLLRKSIVVDGYFPGAIDFDALRNYDAAPPVPPRVSPDDPSNVLYTTGSTGPAKPALYRHRQFANVYRTAHRGWRFDEDARVPIDMAAFPAFQMIAISAGGTVVVPPINFARQKPATVNAKAICEVINAAEVRSLFASPALLERLSDYAHTHALTLPSLERVIGGGAPVFAPLMERLSQVMAPNGEVWSNYGATEALPSTELGSPEALRETAAKTAEGHGICVGRPFPGVEVQVVGPIDLKSSRRADFHTVATGETGELIVRGPNISTAYFEDAASTEKNKLFEEDGRVWHRLGDVGHLDEQGRVWVAGRVSQCVQIGDQRLLPIPIEAIFDQHPWVRRSGLVARPNAAGVPEAVVCVEANRKLSKSEQNTLVTELKTMAQRHTQCASIAGFLLSPGLPVDPRHNAKIERPKLARWAARQP